MRRGDKFTSGLTTEVILDANFAALTYTRLVFMGKGVLLKKHCYILIICVCYNRWNIQLLKVGLEMFKRKFELQKKMSEITRFQ